MLSCFTGTKVLAYLYKSTNIDTWGIAGLPDAGLPDNKKITYLMDIKTIQVLDLVTSHVLATINHDAKV